MKPLIVDLIIGLEEKLDIRYLRLAGSLADVANHSHTVLTDIGTNTHAQIDTFIGITVPNTYANQALSNLSSVAINTSLVSDTDSTDDLGSTTKQWANVYTDRLASATSNLTIENDLFDGDITFKVNDGGVDKTVMTLDGATGRVGIGTTSPNNLLSVYQLIDFNNTDFNIKIGYQAGKNIVSGAQHNTFLGYQAGYASLTASTNAADNNTAIGYRAFYSNTTGNSNFAMGSHALFHNTIGSHNSAIGMYALYFNTTGSSNSAMGFAALYFNTTGSYNSAMGYNALYHNTTGSYNSAIGYAALYSNTTSYYNSALGYNALRLNTTGSYNSAIGMYALRSNTTGYYNSAIGTLALYSNTTGHYNSALGVGAGRYLADGSTANQTSNNSVFLGYNTRANAADGTNEIVIGASAIGAGSNSVVLGNNSITKTLLKGNVGIGTTGPGRKLEINTGAATGGLRLTYNDSNGSATVYADFLIDSGGDLAITATGGDISFNDETLTTTGLITGGGFAVGGTVGIDKSITVLDADGTTTHALSFTKGILTACVTT